MENENKEVQEASQEAPDEKANPDSFDFMDCRPESKYPEANSDAVTPDYIKKMIADRKAGKPADKEEGQAAENDEGEANGRAADQE